MLLLVLLLAAAVGTDRENREGGGPGKREQGRGDILSFFSSSFIIFVHKGVERRREECKEKATRLEGKECSLSSIISKTSTQSCLI